MRFTSRSARTSIVSTDNLLKGVEGYLAHRLLKVLTLEHQLELLDIEFFRFHLKLFGLKSNLLHLYLFGRRRLRRRWRLLTLFRFDKARRKGLLPPFTNLLRSRPVLVLEVNVPSYVEELRCGLNNGSHAIGGLCPLCRVRGASFNYNIVLASIEGVNRSLFGLLVNAVLLDSFALQGLVNGYKLLGFVRVDDPDYLSRIVYLRYEVNKDTPLESDCL